MSDANAKRIFRELQALARADYGACTDSLLVVYAVEGFLRRLAASEYAAELRPQGHRGGHQRPGRDPGARGHDQVWTGRHPYGSPREAAAALLDLDAKATSERGHVEFRSAGLDQDKERRITVAVSDDGCGMTPSQMTSTILQLGSRHKTRPAGSGSRSAIEMHPGASHGR